MSSQAVTILLQTIASIELESCDNSLTFTSNEHGSRDNSLINSCIESQPSYKLYFKVYSSIILKKKFNWLQ